MKRKLTLSPDPATTIAEMRQWVKNAWDSLSQDDIRHLYDRLHSGIHACDAARVCTLCFGVTVWAALTMTCVLPKCDNGWKLLETIYRRMILGNFMADCMREYTPALPPEGVYCVLVWQFRHPLLWHVCFIWSEFVILYSCNDKLPVTSIFLQCTCPWRCCIFPVVYKNF